MGKTLAVIGGGPGGLCAAKEAARLGFKVTLFDSGTIGEQISCAEGFFDILKLLGEPAAGVRFRVRQIILCVTDTFALDCARMNLWMLDRAAWQRALAAEAAASGCRIREHSAVAANDIETLTKKYDWVIDASGARPVSQAYLKLSPVASAPTAQVTLRGDFASLRGKLKAVFEPHYCGYYWIFPRNDSSANVGVGWFGRRRPGYPIREELKRILQKEGLSVDDVDKHGGGPIPVARRRQLVYGNILLVGDAAGLASPLHGGGVDTACISGILAARSLAGLPQQYTDSVERVLGGRLNLEKKMLDTWEKIGHEALHERLKTLFGDGANLSAFKKIKQGITQELAILRYVSEGHLQGDWQSGLQLHGLPFLTKTAIKNLMKGEEP